MHVGVNALFLRPGEVGGTERYLRELLPRLLELEPASRWTVFVSAEARGSFAHLAPQVTEVEAPVRAAHRVRRMAVEQAWLAARLLAGRPEVLWNPGASLPWAAPTPQVTTVHDCLSRVFPQNFGRIERAAIELHVAAATRLSRSVLVPSKAVQGDLLRHYHANPEKIRVTPEAASEEFRALAPEADAALLRGFSLSAGGYFLCAASLLPHKRVKFLIEAYSLALREEPTLPPLVWTGPGDGARVRDWAQEYGVPSQVRALGWTRMDAMPALYRGARACLLPSQFEGFGLAALEALSCGTPLLAAPCPAVLEVAGDACLPCESPSAEAWALQIRRIATQEALRRRLRRAGPVRAAGFSWKETARLTLAALRDAAYQ